MGVVLPQMHAFQRRVIRYWPRYREKARYLVVGCWNTLVWYGCFALLYHLLQQSLAPSAILGLAYVVASMEGYLAFRYLVFTPVRHPVVEYLRYQAVYLPILAVNMVALPLALTYTNVSAYIAQAVFGGFAVVATYIGNKYFAFRRPEVRG
jgi:putative flippase GtrA